MIAFNELKGKIKGKKFLEHKYDTQTSIKVLCATSNKSSVVVHADGALNVPQVVPQLVTGKEDSLELDLNGQVIFLCLV